jgi:hypothetical protein
MIQMHTDVVTETQEEESHASPMSVVTSIAVINMKACAGRLAARAKRLAHDHRGDLAAEKASRIRPRQSLDWIPRALFSRNSFRYRQLVNA